jgi:hypothetical protein
LYADTCSILKKIKNKIHVEASIYKAYIVEDILIFTLYYFEPHLKTRINYIPRNNGVGKLIL